MEVEKQAEAQLPSASPFLEPSRQTKPGSLAIVFLSKDSLQSVVLEQSTSSVDGYAEGATLNNRFGSFPHSTLLDIQWGSQVRASDVDTGTRGRKRKREGGDEDTPTPGADEEEKSAASAPAKKATLASSGFVHVLRPTPELWTSSLPHRTQVVYASDYSYILSRIRARPGTRLIEAGSGSGSFTHAAVRAVYNGLSASASSTQGKVFSFEFNEARFHKMQEELKSHSLEDMVHLSHRNVYEDGFLVNGESPNANAVFLDLPAPWEALRHLSRRKPVTSDENGKAKDSWASPLDPKRAVHICTFSPCIEQVTQTVTDLRKMGWVDVDMVEIMNRRINVLRDRNLPNQAPEDVNEAVSKLKHIAQKTQDFHEKGTKSKVEKLSNDMDVDASAEDSEDAIMNVSGGSGERHWLQGKLIHRPELDFKTHTSYLVFAVLPREWTEEDEAAASQKWPCGKESKVIGDMSKQARKQEKREYLHARKRKKNEEAEVEAKDAQNHAVE